MPDVPLPKLSSPALRALESTGITTLNDVSKFSREEILSLHGIGKSSILPLENALKEAQMNFKNESR